MNWLAEELAGHFDLYAMGPMGCRHATIDPELHVARFVHERLSAPEAIERVARAIHDDECACGDLNNDRYGDDGTLYYLDKARIAVTALLGED